jgi:hypothetical protein
VSQLVAPGICKPGLAVGPLCLYVRFHIAKASVCLRLLSATRQQTLHGTQVAPIRCHGTLHTIPVAALTRSPCSLASICSGTGS